MTRARVRGAGIGTPPRRCTWDQDRHVTCHRKPCDRCQDRNPSSSQELLENSWEAFICVLVALPVIFLFEWVWMRWVRAPVRAKDRFWEAGHGSILDALEREEDDADDGDDVKAVAAAGAHLLQNLGQVVQRDFGVVGLDLQDALRVAPPSTVRSAKELAEWYAVLATVPVCRLVLMRRRELEDARDESDDVDRLANLAFLRKDLDRDWHCDRGPAAFARRVSTQLAAAIALAARYEEKFKDRGSAVQRSAAIYQLLLVQFLDKPVERAVYRRVMDMDFERDLDEPLEAVSLRSWLFASFAAFVLIAGPIAFLLFFGRQLTAKEQWEWWKVAMIAIAIIVLVVEPLRILFLNFILPKVLIPKIKHYSDPAQIPMPCVWAR